MFSNILIGLVMVIYVRKERIFECIQFKHFSIMEHRFKIIENTFKYLVLFI